MVTGADGQARVTYTAPALPTGLSPTVDAGEVVTIWVTPVGDDFGNAVSRALTIRLLPPGTVVAPFRATAGFGFEPATPSVFDPVLFTTDCPDASTADCVRDPGGAVTSYLWDFGDGTSGQGPAPES